MIHTSAKQKGITLLEVLITIIVLTTGMLGLVSLQRQLWYHGNFVKQQTQALVLAQQKIENLRSFEVLNTTGGSTAYDDITSGSQAVNSSSAAYTVAWTVTADTTTGYKNVVTTTSWTDERGTAQSIVLSSRIGKTDPAGSGMVMQNNSPTGGL